MFGLLPHLYRAAKMATNSDYTMARHKLFHCGSKHIGYTLLRFLSNLFFWLHIFRSSSIWTQKCITVDGEHI